MPADLLLHIAEKRQNHSKAHRDHDDERPCNCLSETAHDDSPQRGQHRPTARHIEIGIVKVPGTHLQHAHDYHCCHEVLEHEGVCPMPGIQETPDYHESQVCQAHGGKECDVGVHHARKVAPGVLPDCLACHCGCRELLIAVHEPEVVHAAFLDGDAGLERLRNRLVVLKVDVNDLWPTIGSLLYEGTQLRGCLFACCKPLEGAPTGQV